MLNQIAFIIIIIILFSTFLFWANMLDSPAGVVSNTKSQICFKNIRFNVRSR